MLKALAGAGLAASLAACAGTSSGPMPGGGRLASAPGLFVSPFGELFFSEPGAPWPSADWLAQADADGDARLSFEEFLADGQRVFATLDLDGDTRIGPAEIAVYERGLQAANARLPMGGPPGRPGSGGPPPGFPPSFLADEGGQQMPPGGGMPGGGMPGGEMRGGPPEGGRMRPPRNRAPTGPFAYGPIAAAGFFNYPQPVKAADRDVNQFVTTQEWTEATERWFIALDSDRDGWLTVATLPKTPLQTLLEGRSPPRD
jgi:hypothetical protein